MRAKWITSILLLAVLSLSISLPSNVTRADARCGSDPTCILLMNSTVGGFGDLTVLSTNFDTEHFFAPAILSVTSGGISSNGYGFTPYDSLGAEYHFETTCTVTNISVSTTNTGAQPMRMAFGVKVAGSWSVIYEQLEASGSGSWFIDTSVDNVTDVGIQLTSSAQTIVQIAAFGSCGGGGGGGLPGGLTFPLASSDLHEQWGTYDMQSVMDADPDVDSTYPDTVYSFSNSPDAKVSAVAAGTVTQITPYTGADCDGAFIIFQTLRRCRVFIPQYITQEATAFVFNIELINISLVTVTYAEDENVTFTYWVADAVVAVGDQVVAGCVLGKTIQLKNPTNFELASITAGLSGGADASSSASAGLSASFSFSGTFDIRTLLVDAGVTTVVAREAGERIPLLPFLSEEPNKANCRSSTVTNCTLTNPQLKLSSSLGYVEGWNTFSATPITGGGLHLGYGGSMNQIDVVIDPDIDYNLSILARVTTPIDGQYPLKVAVNSATTTLNFTDASNYQLKVWNLSPREVSTITLSINNEVANPSFYEIPPEIDILYVCFAPATATVSPGACYFPNYNFDADGQGWTSTGSVSFAAGQAIMGDGSIMGYSGAQLLTNTDSSPATYHLTALVRLNSSLSYTGQSGKSVELKYRFPDSGSFVSLGVIDSALVETEGKNAYDGAVNFEHVYTLTDDIVISTNTQSAFDFGVLVTDGDSYLKGLRVDSLCLTSSTDDGSFPGQTGGGFDPPLIPRCGVVPIPIDNNVSSWTFYHWKNLERFFDCTLMIKVNQIAQTVYDAWRTTRLFLRWVIVSVNRAGDWLTTVFWWLNGSFRNVAVGQVTTIYEGGSGQCSDIFCVLSSLISGVISPIVNTITSILGQAANLLFGTLTALLSLIVGILNQLFGIIQTAQGILASLLSAYNSATPATIPGLPTCGIDPKSSPFCMAIWILDNTIFSGTGAAIIPALVALFSIHLLIWVVAEVRSTILTIGQTA